MDHPKDDDGEHEGVEDCEEDGRPEVEWEGNSSDGRRELVCRVRRHGQGEDG